jgi:hypothetical protein
MPYVINPIAMPATAAKPVRMPLESDSAARYVMFGPGVISMISEVNAKASRGLIASMLATLASLPERGLASRQSAFSQLGPKNIRHAPT